MRRGRLPRRRFDHRAPGREWPGPYAYTAYDLIVECRNPRSDLILGGYGLSETEILIKVVTGLLNVMDLNADYFSKNSIPPGVLHLCGNYSTEDLAAFRRYWRAMVNGGAGPGSSRFALPVLVSKDQESKAGFEKFGVEVDDMLFGKFVTFLTSLACGVYGMDPAEISFESFTAGRSPLSGSDTEQKLASSVDKGLRPLLAYFENLFSDYVTAAFGSWVFRWTGLDEDDERTREERVRLVLTVNEIRAIESLELLHKAASEEPPDDKIWQPHPNRLLRALIELLTRRGLTRLAELLKAVEKLLSGKLKPPGASDKPLYRLTPLELTRLGTFLEHGSPESWTPSEWMLAVDWLVQRYLPQDFCVTEGEWAAKRAVLMGRVQAVLDRAPPNRKRSSGERPEDPSEAEIGGALNAAERAPLTPKIQTLLDYGAAHCAEQIVALSDATRHRLKVAILAHQAESAHVGRTFAAGRESLQTRLFDEFGALNRDWRRIAVTEVGEMANQAFVSQCKPGTRLKRVERYDGACAFCRRIDQQVFTVVSPDKPDKDGWTEIWEGKTNVGCSASPMKRVGDQLVPRDPDELWWPAAGLQHPHCRGDWVPYGPSERPGDDPKLTEYLHRLWESTKEPIP